MQLCDVRKTIFVLSPLAFTLCTKALTEGKMNFERTECLKEVELHSTFINTSVKVKEQE